jgi:hypothetical protein
MSSLGLTDGAHAHRKFHPIQVAPDFRGAISNPILSTKIFLTNEVAPGFRGDISNPILSTKVSFTEPSLVHSF